VFFLTHALSAEELVATATAALASERDAAVRARWLNAMWMRDRDAAERHAAVIVRSNDEGLSAREEAARVLAANPPLVRQLLEENSALPQSVRARLSSRRGNGS
jgi:hypothetical protein